jgi:hypothetical protein
MKKLQAGVAALALCFLTTTASAAIPVFGTKESELACVGLVGMALSGASTSKAPEPKAVTALSIALGFYLGRVSKVDPKAGKQDVDRELAKLSNEEKNTHGNACIKKAIEQMGPTLS